MKTKNAKKLLLKKSKRSSKIPIEDFLSTGSTLLNLACSGSINGGYAKGLYTYIVGDSSSGKSFFAMTCLAEASINPGFDDYRFIFDNAENGSLANTRKFFGRRVEERLEPPRGTPDEPEYSTTLEDFYANVDGALKEKKPFIYILDSMDAITTKEEVEVLDEKNKSIREGKKDKGKGTYGTGKAKMNSANLRTITNRLKKTGSILIIISQTRDNIGFGAQFNPKSRSGGHALRFYARIEIWTSVIKRIKHSVNGIERKIGAVTKVEFKKNHITGWEGNYVEVPFYRSVGFDDLGGCVDYLTKEGWWKETNKVINAQEFDVKLKREALVKHIEEKELQKKLRKLVGQCWRDVEAQCSVQRKGRYD